MILNLLARFRGTRILNKANLLKIQYNNVQNRPFYHWLNVMFNQVDPLRVKEVGIERACAEWLLRNGASVKWVGEKNYLKNYNALPKQNVRFVISEVDASGSSISHYGFMHFEGCSSIRKIILHDCGYIEDEALNQLHFVKNTLEELQVSLCGNITDAGLRHIKELTKLKNLILFNLPYVKEKDELVNELQAHLPKCNISFDDIDGDYFNENLKMKKPPKTATKALHIDEKDR